MNAIFKNKNRILITGSDRDEKILIKDFATASEEKDIKITTLVDINGEETGLSIELVERAEENLPEVEDTDVSEPTPSE